MPLLQAGTLSNQNISTTLACGTYTATRELSSVMGVILANQVAGGGDYSVYLTRQLAGAGSAYKSAVTSVTLATGVYSFQASTIPFPLNNTDVCVLYVTGLAGDTTTPDIITEFWDFGFLRPTTAGRTIAVDANGKVDTTDTAAPTVGQIDTQLSTTHGSGAWGGGTGGALTLNYTVTDSVTALPVQGATVELYATAGMTSIIDSQTTNVLGAVAFANLVAGTYYLKIIRAGYVTGTDSEVVS